MTDVNDSSQLRCECGKLLFKVVGEFLEIKCNRCKRIQMFPLKDILQNKFSGNKEN